MGISVLEQFKQWLLKDGRADSTIQSYINDVQKFNHYLVERDADPEVLLSRFYFTSYLKQLENGYARKITAQNPWKIRTRPLQISMKYAIFGGDFLLEFNFIILKIRKCKRMV